MDDNQGEQKKEPRKVEVKDEDWDSVNQPRHDPKEDYEEASRSTADYASYEPPQKKRDPIWRKLLIVFVILVVVAGLGGGAYWYLKNNKTTKKEGAQPAQTTQTAKPATDQIATATKRYDSPNFYLGFDHPQDWKVTDGGGGQMNVVSPSVQLKGADGKSVSGQIVMTIRSKDQKLPEFDGGNAMAAVASQKINYTKPSQNQRGSTYLSYLRYATTASSTGLDGVYITGDNGYTVGQAVPKVDISKVDPIISISFLKCSGSDCTGVGTPLSIAASSFEDKTFSGPLENMLKSLSIQ